MKSSLKAHKRRKHRSLDDPLIPCREEGCKKTFPIKSQETIHSEEKRKRGRVECPRADKFGCKKTFVNIYSARQHLQAIHVGRTIRYPCKWKECNRTFIAKSSANMHYRGKHQGAKFKCRGAKDYHCGRELTRSKVSCPVVGQFNCKETFALPKHAKRHARLHTLPFTCLRPHCTEGFKTF